MAKVTRNSIRSRPPRHRLLYGSAALIVLCLVPWMLNTDGELSFSTSLLQEDFSHVTEEKRSNNHHQEEPPKYEPTLDCFQYIKKAPRTLNEGSADNSTTLDPNEGRMFVRRTITTNPFWISLHNRKFDGARWQIFRHGIYYEQALTKAFTDILQASPPQSHILDVGGNIGFFTLHSASLGTFRIHTFEPNPHNLLRLCESLSLNHWNYNSLSTSHRETTRNQSSTVFVHPEGIGDQDEMLLFREDTKNPGAGTFIKKTPKENQTVFKVTKLDTFVQAQGWFDTRPHIAILKIDVEGTEGRVISGASRLLESHLVRNILMEISVKRAVHKRRVRPALVLLQKAGYVLHMTGGSSGPKHLSPFPHDETLPDKIMAQCQSTGGQLNLWWKLPTAVPT